ncbi:predicted protein [Histoplasma mississippiense (nom. inval.)]|nr:predicted protein [Histoplasma mississippiense (nom. inval.)]EDN03778.1 predicted protein [Histoplasma mississippiense (nom. inval.)]
MARVVNLQADNISLQSTYPRIFADCDPTCRAAIHTPSSSQLCHRHESVPVQWPHSSFDPFHLILARLLFLFCDVVCIFADDVGGLEAVRSLLMKWATIGSASTLPGTIRPRIIIVTGKDNDSITQALLNGVDDEPFVWQAARATSAAPVLFPSIDIPSVGSFQDGGMKQRHNNPIRLGLSEVRRLWPRTPKPHVVISLGTGTVSRVLKTSDSRNILLDGWLPRIYRSYMSSFDGEETWNELQGELDDQSRKNYFRFNHSFTGARPSIVDISAMENISQSIQKNPSEADKMEEALLTLLASSLFFELDSIPEFQNGFFLCVGTIRCYEPARLIIRALLALRPAHHEFYKDDINLGLYISEDDICVECQRYCGPVRFAVRHLEEKITMTLRSDGTALLLNGSPNAIQWYIDEQGLDGVFGASNHGAPFRVQCDTCERRLNGKEKKRKYMYTR